MASSPAAVSGRDQRTDDPSGGMLEYLPDGSTIPEETWRTRHRWFVLVVLAHVPILLVLGLLEGTESTVTGITLPQTPLWRLGLNLGLTTAFAGAAAVGRFPRRLRTVFAVTALAFTSGSLVMVTGGYIEAHFHFFVATGMFALYEDWLPFGIGIVYVVLTHGVFGMMRPSLVYNHTAAQVHPWVWGLIHGAFVAMLATALTAHLIGIEKSRRAAQRRLAEAEKRANRIDDLEQRQAEIEEEKAEAERAREEAERRRTEAQRLKEEAEQKRADIEDLNAHLREKATAYGDTMHRAADGDLTARVDPDSESQPMTDVGEAFNEMLDQIEALVAEIAAFSEDVDSRTRQVDDGMQEVATASEEASEAVQEIVDGTDEQQAMLEDVAREMSTLSAAVEEVAASAQTVAATSDETAAIAADGQDLADEMRADAEQVQRAIEETTDTVGDLETQMAEIGEIVDLIGDVAEQTNMLALNANIEAARAGEGDGDSEGFAVVADEVKSLAEETQASAADIQDRIERAQRQTAETVSQVERARDLIEREIEAVDEVVEAFADVAENAKETDDGIQEISTTTDDQATTGEEVVTMLDDVAAISEQSAARARAAADAADRQTERVAEVDEATAATADQVARLTDRLAAFTVDAADDRPTGSSSAPALGDGGTPGWDD